MSVHIQRLESGIKKELTKLIATELKDPKIGFCTITDVKVTTDLSYAKVYCSFLGADPRNEAGLKALNRAKGHIKSELARSLNIRKIPDLNFIRDESLERGERIEKILNRVIKD